MKKNILIITGLLSLTPAVLQAQHVEKYFDLH